MEMIKEIAVSSLMGIIQGLTEFLPVSSSGHIELAKHVFNFHVHELFTILLHLATLFAVVIAFRKRLGDIIASLFRLAAGRKRDGDAVLGRLTLLLAFSTVVTVGGALLLSGVKDTLIAEPRLIGAAFLFTALLLILTAFFREKKDLAKIGVVESAVIGAAQGIGVLPGVSRSGITISAALASGMTREASAEYSFLLCIPAIIGAFIFDLREASTLMLEISVPALVAGIITAFLCGLLSIFLLLKLIKKGRLYLFSIYLIPLGILTLIFA